MEFANYKSIKIRTKEGRKTMEKTKKIGPVALGAVFMAYFCSITAVPTGGLVDKEQNSPRDWQVWLWDL